EAANELKTVADVRGKGLMFAAALADPATGAPSPQLAAKALEATKERGLLVGKGGLHGATLRMAPPLTLTQDEAREGLALLTDALRAVNAGAGAEVMETDTQNTPSKDGTHRIGG